LQAPERPMAIHASDAHSVATGLDRKQMSADLAPTFTVTSPYVQYSDNHITSKYAYRTTDVEVEGGQYIAMPKETLFDFKTERIVGKVGVVLVGWVSCGTDRNRRTCNAGMLTCPLFAT